MKNILQNLSIQNAKIFQETIEVFCLKLARKVF